jgi:sugar phosphate isomerase/epimerase
MMRLLMHSMACPNIEPEAAFALAHELELDGIELICQADYRCAIAPDAPLGEARRLAAAARDAGSRVATLTPYTKGMNSPDAEERSKAVRELKHCVSLAAELGARIVRVFGGAEVPAQEEDAARQRLAGSLRPLGDQAQALGLTL